MKNRSLKVQLIAFAIIFAAIFILPACDPGDPNGSILPPLVVKLDAT